MLQIVTEEQLGLVVAVVYGLQVPGGVDGWQQDIDGQEVVEADLSDCQHVEAEDGCVADVDAHQRQDIVAPGHVAKNSLPGDWEQLEETVAQAVLLALQWLVAAPVVELQLVQHVAAIDLVAVLLVWKQLAMNFVVRLAATVPGTEITEESLIALLAAAAQSDVSEELYWRVAATVPGTELKLAGRTAELAVELQLAGLVAATTLGTGMIVKL